MLPEKGVYHKSIQAGKWFVLGTLCQKLINLAPFFVLARLLRPEDYGVIAVVFMIIGFLDRFSTPGFSSALMQKQTQTEYYLNTMWTYELLKAAAIAIFLYASGGILGNFFHIHESQILLIQLSGILPFISALSNPKQFYFFSELDGRKIFWRDTIGQVAYLVISISIAYTISPTAWALFFGYIGRYIVSAGMSYVLAPAWPRLSFAFKRLRQLIPYGKWIYGQSVLDYLLGFVDNFLIGRFLGTEGLGLYTRARDLPTTISSPLVGIMTKVSFPAYAKIQDDHSKIKLGFLRSLDVLLPLNILFSLLLALEGGAIVTAFLGVKWFGIVLPLKILAVANIFSAFVMMVKPVFNALNRPQVNVTLGLMQLVLSALGIWVGVLWFGILGAAAAVLIVWFVLWIFSILAMRQVIAVSRKELFPVLGSVAVAGSAVFFLDFLLRSYFHQFNNAWLIIIWVTILTMIYVFLIIVGSKYYHAGPWLTFKSILIEVGILRA